MEGYYAKPWNRLFLWVPQWHWQGSAGMSHIGLSSHGSSTHRRSHMTPVLCGSGSGQEKMPCQFNSQLLRLVLGTQNITCLVRKQLTIFREVERYCLDIARAHLITQLKCWNQSPWKGLNPVPRWSCTQWETVSRSRYISITSVCCMSIGIFPGRWES